MIIKPNELIKNYKNFNFFLFYGQNDGYKKEIVEKLKLNNPQTIVINFIEKDILERESEFYNLIMSKSFFENSKIILVNFVTDKIFRIIKELKIELIDDVILILISNILDKKSKLRNFFEKDKNLACTPFYEDNYQTLTLLVYNFCKKKNISISTIDINFLIDRCKNDRIQINQELEKIELLSKSRPINFENIRKLTNINNNENINKLIDCILAKNKKKTFQILNDNTFNSDEAILIIRTFLIKTKKLLTLAHQFKSNRDLDATISNAKPVIFWKDKDLVKQQIVNWKPINLEKLIFNLNNLEVLVKKNINFSTIIIVNFITEQFSSKINN